MIHGPDGKKLSKRHGAQAVSEFDDMGYLPEALRNYLAKLGWGHGDDEIFSDAQAAAWFDIRDVVGAPARLDWDKLNHLNNHYLRKAEPERLAGLVEKVLKSRDWPVRDGDTETLLRTLPLVREGAPTVLDLADAVIFALRRRPLDLPEKARALLTDETRARLGRLSMSLEGSEWTVPALEATIRSFAETEGVGIGKFGPALRAVLSGGSPAPDLAGTLISIGKAESLARIQDALPN
jgi:glutamyl-tRNA synthetase